jgi:hypothetical protein
VNKQNQRLHRSLRTVWSLVSNILQIISAIISIVTLSFVAAFFAGLAHFQNLVVPLITFALGVLVAGSIMLVFYFLRASILLKKSPPRWLLRSYKYVKTESLYKIHEDDTLHHTFTITTKIEAIESGVNIFENTYRWTGKGKEEKPKVVSSGHVLLGETVNDSGWKYYYVHLGQPLNIGDATEIVTIQELYDTENSFDSYLAKIISQPVDLLTLRVILPRNTLPTKIDFTEWNIDGPAGNIIKSTLGTINHQNGEICYLIKKPVIRRKYEIRWKY